MNSKKQRDKRRRRARKLAEQAWNAAHDHQVQLAAKIIRRAVELDPGNPVLWNDQGRLLYLLNEDDQAAESFHAAITLAPDFAEAYTNLARIRARQSKCDQAVALQRQAVRYAPELEHYRQILTAYEALAASRSVAGAPSIEAASLLRGTRVRTEHELRIQFQDVASRIDAFDWPELQAALTCHGCVLLQELLSPQQCESLRRMFDEVALFSKTVTMAKARFGKGIYRYFAAPIPDLVEAIRQLMYPRVARVANSWQRLLREDATFPASWNEFRQRCRMVGQTTPSPLMLRYTAGGFNALHQDIRGAVFFPLQLVVVLSPRIGLSEGGDTGFGGGEFLFCDQPERKSDDRRSLPAGLGDAVLFCTRARPVNVAGTHGLKPVKHGMDYVTSGTRYALGIPFHDFE